MQAIKSLQRSQRNAKEAEEFHYPNFLCSLISSVFQVFFPVDTVLVECEILIILGCFFCNY